MAFPAENLRADSNAERASKPAAAKRSPVVDLADKRQQRALSDLILPRTGRLSSAAALSQPTGALNKTGAAFIYRTLAPLAALLVIAAGVGLHYHWRHGGSPETAPVVIGATAPVVASPVSAHTTNAAGRSAGHKKDLPPPKRDRQLTEQEKAKIRLLVLLLQSLH